MKNPQKSVETPEGCRSCSENASEVRILACWATWESCFPIQNQELSTFRKSFHRAQIVYHSERD